MDINKIVVSNKVFFCKKDFKYFISYKNAKTIRLLCIFLLKICAYIRNFDETKCMSFLIKNEKIGNKVSKNIKTEFGSKPVDNEKYLKTKIKSYTGKVNTNSQKNEIPKEESQ